MVACKVLFLYVFSFINSNCDCYEGINDVGDIYTLYVKGSTCELVYLSNFHGEYTPFNYQFDCFLEKTLNQKLKLKFRRVPFS